MNYPIDEFVPILSIYRGELMYLMATKQYGDLIHLTLIRQWIDLSTSLYTSSLLEKYCLLSKFTVGNLCTSRQQDNVYYYYIVYCL